MLNQCLSPLMLWVRTPLRRGVVDTTLCNKVCQWLATGRGFSPVSYTNKTDRHYITEILLKVALNTIKLNQTFGKRCFSIMHYDKRKNRTTRDLGKPPLKTAIFVSLWHVNTNTIAFPYLVLDCDNFSLPIVANVKLWTSRDRNP